MNLAVIEILLAAILVVLVVGAVIISQHVRDIYVLLLERTIHEETRRLHEEGLR